MPVRAELDGAKIALLVRQLLIEIGEEKAPA
jgi:hypothetical protein